MTKTEMKCAGKAIGWSEKEANDFCKELRKNPNYRHLDLIANGIGKSSVASGIIFKELQENQYITSINLLHNHIGDNATGCIAGMLRHNQRLQSITLACNHIGADSDREKIEGKIPSGTKYAQILAAGLGDNEGLKSINLSGNDIGISDRVSQAFADAIDKNKTLTNVDLTVNQIESNDTAKEIFADLFAKCHAEGRDLTVKIAKCEFNTKDIESIENITNEPLRNSILAKIEHRRSQETPQAPEPSEGNRTFATDLLRQRERLPAAAQGRG